MTAALSLLATEPCAAWLATRAAGAPAATHVADAATGLLCFDGSIDASAAATFVAAIRAIPANRALTLAVRSNGGEVGAALDMAEAVARRRVTVIAVDRCLSSCANYLLPAGTARIVAAGAILGFHGGVRTMTAVDFATMLRNQGISDAAAAEALVAQNTALIARQTAFARARGVSPTFFAWMDRYNRLPAARRSRICPDTAGFFVFAPTLLAAYGYRIDRNDGPRNAATLRAVLVARGDPADGVCYVARNAAWR